MKTILKSNGETRLPRPVVGCATQGTTFLAMAVSGDNSAWNIHWKLGGDIRDASAVARLSAKVGRMPFWVTPTKDGAAQMDFALSVEVPEDENLAKPSKLVHALLKTQVETRFGHVADAVEHGGTVFTGDDGSRCLVGFGATRPNIKDDFDNWRKRVKIANPHIASPGAALANVFLTFLSIPEETRGALPPCVMLLVNGRVTTLAVTMKGPRLIEAVEYQMVEGQKLDPGLVAGWTEFVRSRHESEPIEPVPVLLVSEDGPSCGFENKWNPFAASEANTIRGSRELLAELASDMDLASIAFGMALQGGI